MNNQAIIKEVERRLKKSFKGEPTGHDWWHSARVRNLAKKIARKEGGDLFVIELASLLHDIDDWKFSKASPTARARRLLGELGVDKGTIERVCYIIENISFKGAGVEDKMRTKEGKIVQDADRLDVIGAVGIARAFAYGGYKKREIHNPQIKPKLHKTFKEYKAKKGTTINHFYEKILLLKDRLHTNTAKQIAEKRHKFVENYLKQFFKEWEGEL